MRRLDKTNRPCIWPGFSYAGDMSSPGDPAPTEAPSPAPSPAPAPASPPVTPAPEFDVSEWIGEPSPLASLRGKVVLAEAFQMLCAGCVNYGIPQPQRVARMFPDVAVIGLHTVFEHHDVTGPEALKVFLHEFGVRFPVGIDRHDGDDGPGQALPATMRTYRMEGTPTTLLFDKHGQLVFQHLGKVDDLALGVMIGQLIAAPGPGV